MQQTLVLIVAPRGLAHARAWEAWEKESRVIVHAPERAEASEYERSRRLNISFGDPEMVVGGIAHLGETLRAMCEVCDRHESFDLVLAPPDAVPTRRLDFSTHSDTAPIHSLWGAVLSRDTCLRLVAALWTPESFHRAAIRTLAKYGHGPEKSLGGCMATYALPEGLIRAVDARVTLARGAMRRELIKACASRTAWFVAGDEQSLDDKFLATLYGGSFSSVMDALAAESATLTDHTTSSTLRTLPDFRLWYALEWGRWRDAARRNGYSAALTTAELKRAGILEPPNALALGEIIARVAVAALGVLFLVMCVLRN